MSGFRWTTFDLTGRLPGKWQQEIAAVAAAEAEFREFPRTPSLSREAAVVHTVSRGRLHAGDLRHNLPWLYGLYRSLFLNLAQVVSGEPVRTARDDRYGIVLNVQCGTEMRFECHVDSNPLTGLLFCTDHPAGRWRARVRARPGSRRRRRGRPGLLGHPAARGPPDLLRRAASHPHYARPLLSRVGHADRRGHELLHCVVPGDDAATGRPAGACTGTKGLG